MNPTTLTQAIATIIDESQRLDPDEFADELARIVDDMTVGKESENNADDLYLEAIVNGIRWGARAAVNVERDRGAMLRVCLPDGIRITHEWADDADADQAIKDALAAIEGARVTALEAERDKLRSEKNLLRNNVTAFVREIESDVIRVRPSDRDALMALLTDANTALAKTEGRGDE